MPATAKRGLGFRASQCSGAKGLRIETSGFKGFGHQLFSFKVLWV